MKPTTDEVLAWAREAGLLVPVYRDHITDLQTLAALAYAAGAAEERERCAKVCDWMQATGETNYDNAWNDALHESVKVIRALGDDDE